MKNLPDGYSLLYLTTYGSKLYGTDTPNSDTDYRGIFLPSLRDVVLGKAPETIAYSTGDKNSRNGCEDIDYSLYSMSKFIQLISKGETSAIDMMFSMFREDTIIESNKDFIGFMKDNYKDFLSRNASSFKGYCIQQAKKYGIKGSRFGELQSLIELMQKYDTMLSLSVAIPYQEYKYISTDSEFITVLEKKFHLKSPWDLFVKNITKMHESYGERSKLAKEENGIDWKALSHAVRVIFEIKEIADTGFLKFPLKDAEYIKKIKSGQVPLEDCLSIIEESLETLDEDVLKLPESVNLSNLEDYYLSILK